MREFLREILHALEAGEPVELVSVVRSSGSTPRGAGAMMAVFTDGHAAGTVGGGNAEFASQKHAAELLEKGGEDLCRFRFIQGEAASLGMVCGGDVEVQFQYLSPEDGEAVAILRELKEACAHSADVWLVRRIESGHVTAMGTADREGVHHLAAPPEELAKILGNKAVYDGTWFAVPVVKAGRTYIFGGGHVSQALVPVLAAVDFRPVVYDDRPEFADPALFPGAEQVLCGSFLELSEHLHGDSRRLRGHYDPGPSGGLRGADPGAAQRGQISGVHWFPEEAGTVPGQAVGKWVYRSGIRPRSMLPSG